MPSPQELTSKFWKALASDRTMMVGLDGAELLLGADPKKELAENTAQVRLG
jgi:hypothetical protein